VLRKWIGIVCAAMLLAGLGFPGLARAAGGWRWPVRGQLITRYRNGPDPYAAGQHRGIDVAAPVGAPVLAATGGRVRFAGLVGSSGLVVAVRTADGRYDTSYLHLSGIAVRAGARVRAGQRLGAVGTSGRRSARRPHLHFGVRVAGSRHGYRDPLDFLPPPAPGRRSPRGAPAPLALPDARPAPVRIAPGDQPVRVPAGAPRPVPAPRAFPVGDPLPAPVHARPRGEVPALGPAPRSLPAPIGVRPPAHVLAGRSASDAPGIDVGWLLLCGGLLLAGGFMGTSHDARARGGARLRAALRPLMGLGR
jgi:Peptidase family M23